MIFDRNSHKFSWIFFRTRVEIIGKCCIWADENIIFYSCAIPDLDTGFNRDVISNKYITLYEGMCANVAISANSRTF